MTKAAYYAAHREEILERRGAYYVARREEARAYNAAYYAAHRENRRARYDARREEVRAYNAIYGPAYRAANREKIRAWKAAHPDVWKADKHRRRARKLSNGGSYTAAEWRHKLDLFAHRCAYCGTDGKMVVEHATPLSRGGTNDITNIVPACAPCNLRKGTRTAEEFMAVAA